MFGSLAAAQRRFGLGIGEVSIILLGHELKADVLLIDDMKARKLAQEHGLAVLGCVGVLQDAFNLKLIRDLPAAYRQMLACGAYVDRVLLESILNRLNLPSLWTHSLSSNRSRLVCTRLTGISVCFLSSMRNW